ncbi:MAG: NYN domain-containing protein [Desulfomonilaceae bacterium]
MRVRIFIDFMNFSLGVKLSCGEGYRLDYQKLSGVLCREATECLPAGIYEGTHVYASANPTSRKDQDLVKFFNTTLSTFRGYDISIFERRHKPSPECKMCGREIEACPHCGNPTSGTIEKGVDAAIVTGMLSHAWNDSYDIGVLLSTDRDFIPAVEFLHRRGKKSFTPALVKKVVNYQESVGAE